MAFMTHLENSRFIYCNDFGGLCLICNEYEFGVFCLYKIIYKNFKQYLIF